jgi:hypothetical protein
VLRVLALVLLLLVLVLTYQVTRTGLALRAAKADASTLRTQLTDKNQSAALGTARDLAHQAEVAHDHSDNVLWKGLGLLPVVGDDVSAVRLLSSALDQASSAVPQALTLYDGLGGGLRTADGRLDLATIASLHPSVAQMATRLSGAQRTVSPIDPATLLSPLRAPVDKALQDLTSVAAAARAGSTATSLLPQMLGSQGTRTYVLAAQNNAEIRSTGGVPGSLSILTATDGKIALGRSIAYPDFREITTPVEPVPPDEAALYQDSLAYDVRDTTATPDFPSAASRIAALVQRDFGITADGVVSIDPVTLAAVLGATGPVTGARGEELTADNALAKLLNEPYQRFDSNEVQNAYFAAMTKAIFDRFLGSDISPALLTTLTDAVDQRRVLVWSRHADEQQPLTGTAIAGGLPQGRSSSPQVGMYLNDSTGAKIEYYLRYRTTFTTAGCTDGRQRLRATMTLDSEVPQDTSTLSKWVAGFYYNRAPRGWMRLHLRVYAPTGGEVTGMQVDGKRVSPTPLPHDGRMVSFVELLLKPGQTIPISVDLLGPRGADADPRMEWTPSMVWGPTSATVPSACS